MTDYDALRTASKQKLEAQASDVQSMVTKLQKAQRAAEDALDMYDTHLS